MRSDTPLDYAVFQLSPKRSRCELFVSGDGRTEKLASGLLKPFVTHLTVAEEQVAQAVNSIKLDVERRRNEGSWFTKGTLERFVRFVSTPEVLELVSTFDAEMSQLEAARRIYLQGVDSQLSSAKGGEIGTGSGDITKKELLKAIDVRLVAVKQDLTTACARASAAGFTPDTVRGLQLFAERFGAHRLHEACTKFISLSQRRAELANLWRTRGEDGALRMSCESDMSIDDPSEESITPGPSGPQHLQPSQQHWHEIQSQTSQERETSQHEPSKSAAASLTGHSLRESSIERDEGRDSDGPCEDKHKKQEEAAPESPRTTQPARRLSVQDRINMFESKQKEQSKGSSGGKVVVGKSVELRRLSSDVSSAGQAAEKAVLRRWSGASDMSVDSSYERKESGSSASAPSAVSISLNQSSTFASMSDDRDNMGLKDTDTSLKVDARDLPGVDSGLKDWSVPRGPVEDFSSKEEAVESQVDSKMQSHTFGRSDRTAFNYKTDSEGQSRLPYGRTEVVGFKEQSASRSQVKPFSGRREDETIENQVLLQSQSRTSSGKVEDLELNSRGASPSQFETCSSQPEQLWKDQNARTLVGSSFVGKEHAAVKDHVISQGNFRPILGQTEDAGQVTSQTELEASVSRVGIGSADDPPQLRRVENVRMSNQLTDLLPLPGSMNAVLDAGSNSKVSLVSQLPSKPFMRKVDSDFGTKDRTGSHSHDRGSEGGLLASRSERSDFQEKVDVEKKDLVIPRTQFGGLAGREEDYGLQGKKLPWRSSDPEKSNNLYGKKGKNAPVYANDEPAFPQSNIFENSDILNSILTTPVEQAQKGRLSKGNQDLNNELQIKANELEKLFAEHKLRVPGDLSATTRRSRPAEMQAEQVASAVNRKPVEVTPVRLPEKNPARESFGSSSKLPEFDSNSLLRLVDVKDFGSTLKQNVTEIAFTEDSRGKFYSRYMQKRDAKLREEWSSKGAQKEAKMKAMQDSLEQSRAEMKAKFTLSADRQDSALYARRRAEKLRSFNVRNLNREQQPVDSVQNEEENMSEFPEQSQYGGYGSFGETFLGDASSRNVQSKKLLPNRGLSSSNPRTPVALVPKSSARPSHSGSARRRTQPENSLAQSVPNFSDFRKENTKPSSVISKIRPQLRTARSKSTSEELSVVKEDKPRRSQSMRKTTASSGELKDLSSVNSDGVVLTPLRFDKEQNEQSKFPKNGELKSFLRKGNGIGPGSGAGIAKLRASMASENLKTDEEIYELANQMEESGDTSKEEEEEEPEALTGEETLEAMEYADDSDNEKPGVSKESEKSGDPESENGEVSRPLSQADRDLVDEVAATMPSMFRTSVGPVQDSPGESPASWNSRGHHPFSYAQETSDIDAFVDSPMGSPASWKSHSLTHMDADAARMRKKWGSAQKPILVANASHQQSRKDVTKGFKRLLKFGRKSRGTESLVDWISATTSEGDDDTEDVNYIANRSSEDLRKSRMGFSQDGFNDGELFNDQVQAVHSSIPTPSANFRLRDEHLSGSSLKAPRSFFSLSSFRSKGSESKPR